jgi:hypothetical protein
MTTEYKHEFCLTREMNSVIGHCNQVGWLSDQISEAGKHMLSTDSTH